MIAEIINPSFIKCRSSSSIFFGNTAAVYDVDFALLSRACWVSLELEGKVLPGRKSVINHVLKVAIVGSVFGPDNTAAARLLNLNLEIDTVGSVENLELIVFRESRCRKKRQKSRSNHCRDGALKEVMKFHEKVRLSTFAVAGRSASNEFAYASRQPRYQSFSA